MDRTGWLTGYVRQVFRWWHVSSTATLLLSLLGVIALSMGYEYVRELSRRYEARVDAHAIANGGMIVPPPLPPPRSTALIPPACLLERLSGHYRVLYSDGAVTV